MKSLPREVEELLTAASTAVQGKRASGPRFVSNICGSPWDRVIEQVAAKAYLFVGHALGMYAVEPLPVILPIEDGQHSSGANASFDPSSGQVRLSPSIVEGKYGTTMEKLTHELTHAALAAFPEGDPFYEEGFVDYSVWVMAHAPAWEPHRADMIAAADFNIACRRDRAIRDLSDYDRKRWAGGVFCATMHGPWIVTKLRHRKLEGDLRW